MIGLAHLRMLSVEFRKVRIIGDVFVVSYYALERTTQERVLFKYQEHLPTHWESLTEEEKLSWVRQSLIQTLTHEVDECLFGSGLAKDPHS